MLNDAIPKPEPLYGVAFGLHAERYFEEPALNCSTLKAFATLDDVEPEETAAMALGSLAHCAILEPDQLDKRYYRTTVERRGTKAWEAEVERSEGREVVKAQDYDAAQLMALSIHEHSEAMEFLRGARFEVSCFWVDPETGLPCKCRADAIGAHLVDIKTTVSVKHEKFSKVMFERRYDWADAHYCDGFAANELQFDRMYFIAVEKTPKLLVGSTAKRHMVGIFKFDDDDRATARDKIFEARRTYAYCLRNNDWPGYEASVQTAIKPRYLREEF